MRVVCQCPNCLAEVVGLFQRSCVVCEREIPADLRMTHIEVEASQRKLLVWSAAISEDRELESVGSLTLLVEGSAVASDATWLRDAESMEPREMDWDDDQAATGASIGRRRWFRRK